MCITFDLIFFFILQLYELDSDPKRKEFLDDLFVFMQKKGEVVIYDTAPLLSTISFQSVDCLGLSFVFSKCFFKI